MKKDAPITRNVIPPSVARFPGFVEAEKYPIAEGIPSPKYMPKTAETEISSSIDDRGRNIGSNDKKIPPSIQKERKRLRF
jgi:hypothetical protein